MNKKNNIIVFIIAILVSRIILYFSVESPAGTVEALYVGTVAKSLIEGLIMPYWDYQFSSYDGGILLAGIIEAPIFLIFGSTSFSLFLGSILFTLGTYSIWYLLLLRSFSRRIANIFSLFYLFAPFLYLRWSLTFTANHMEVSFFIALFLYLYCYFLEESKNGNIVAFCPKKAVIFGLVAGLGAWFCYSFVIIMLVCFICWYIYCRKITIKFIFSLFLGFLIGYSPALFRMGTFGPLIKEDIFDRLVILDLKHFWIKFEGFFHVNLSGTSPIFMNAYWLMATVAFLFLIWVYKDHIKRVIAGTIELKATERRKLVALLPITMFPAIYVVVYCVSGFDIVSGDSNFSHYRYYLPIFPFVFSVLAVFSDYFLSMKNRLIRVSGGIIVLLILCVGIGDVIINKNHLSPPEFSRYHKKGYSYEMLGSVFSWRFGDNSKKVTQLIHLLDPSHREEAYFGFGLESGIIKDDRSIRGFADQISGLKYRESYINGVLIGKSLNLFSGTEMGESYPSIIGTDDSDELEKYFIDTASKISTFSGGHRKDSFKSLGLQYVSLGIDRLGILDELLLEINAPYRKSFLEGIDLGITIKNQHTKNALTNT